MIYKSAIEYKNTQFNHGILFGNLVNQFFILGIKNQILLLNTWVLINLIMNH